MLDFVRTNSIVKLQKHAYEMEHCDNKRVDLLVIKQLPLERAVVVRYPDGLTKSVDITYVLESSYITVDDYNYLARLHRMNAAHIQYRTSSAFREVLAAKFPDHDFSSMLPQEEPEITTTTEPEVAEPFTYFPEPQTDSTTLASQTNRILERIALALEAIVERL